MKKNKKSGKASSTLFIVVGVIGLLVAGFFVTEGFRLGEMKDNLPEYVVHEDADAAVVAAISLAKENPTARYNLSKGLSNSWYLPFSQSFVVTEPVKYDDLKKHDFVVYINGAGVKVFHRLIKETDDGWMAQGDSNPNPDVDLVTHKNILGRLIEPIHTWESVIIQ